MPLPKGKNILELTLDELTVRLRDLRQEGLHLRLQKSIGQLENSARIQQVRRETAQVLTALRAKSLA
jgi:large subunit ribosomal protein L29